MTKVASAILLFTLVATAGAAAQDPPSRHLSLAGVGRASATVDSVFVDRTLPDGLVAPGDWASYLLARLGGAGIPESVGILVAVDSTHIEVSGRLRDLPPEARALLGPLAAMVDSNTVVVADVTLDRTGREIARFHLRSLVVNGFPFPEFLLATMMARVGSQYPELSKTGRDLYVQIPADGSIVLVNDAVRLTTTTRTSGDPAGRR
ncbi:MAG: hypothetical protein AB7R55_12395 [Gemmatimonadales bacterium]